MRFGGLAAAWGCAAWRRWFLRSHEVVAKAGRRCQRRAVSATVRGRPPERPGGAGACLHRTTPLFLPALRPARRAHVSVLWRQRRGENDRALVSVDGAPPVRPLRRGLQERRGSHLPRPLPHPRAACGCRHDRQRRGCARPSPPSVPPLASCRGRKAGPNAEWVQVEGGLLRLLYAAAPPPCATSGGSHACLRPRSVPKDPEPALQSRSQAQCVRMPA